MTSLHDLGLAYRKAKVDLYYSSHASLTAIADYEAQLHANLADLHAKIHGDDESWVTKPEFIGGWTLATKTVEMNCWNEYREKHGNGLIFSSPAEEWTNACALLAADEPPQKPGAEFRVMAQCSVDFHVLSALWMVEVGHLFDTKLTRCAYGNRLRRTQDGKGINRLSLGSFQPYLKPFREWRDRGIATMRGALEAGKKIVALTADVSSFYHELNPGFMLDPAFVSDLLGLELTAPQTKLHRMFIHALVAWAATTPLKKGLPVGLPASAVVANLALVELDRIIERQCTPLYYGRYVDDILLVIDNAAGFHSTFELWEWLFERSGGKLGWIDQTGRKKIGFAPAYLSDSQIQFANAKNKVFVLAGDSGKTLVDAIAHQIHERASEWRAMPRLPHSAQHVGTDLLAATQSDGEAADNLRKADALTMRRAGFAIKLRDFEAYERDLAPEAWREHRRAFFRAFVQHVLVLPQFFDLAVYLPRIVRLATACEDFEDLRKILHALEQLCKQVAQNCTLRVKACPAEQLPSPDDLIDCWQRQLYTTVQESISAAFPPRLSTVGKQAWQAHMADYLPTLDIDLLLRWPASCKSFQIEQARLFSFDLAHMPFRFIGLPIEMVAQRGIPARKTVAHCPNAADLLPSNVIGGIGLLAKSIRFKSLPHGLLFACRPYNLPELFILNKAVYEASEHASLKAVVLAVRGFSLGKASPSFDKHGVLKIPNDQPQRQYGIAVSSWKTRMASWTAAVMQMPDPDAGRYARLCRLLDGVIAQPQHSRYLILPELALPAHWFIRIARKLQGRGISLITGVEYLHASKARVRNQVWAALSHTGLGFPSLMIYRQDKQRPALHEEQELARLGKLELKPDTVWRTPPILQHGDLRFALVVCPECFGDRGLRKNIIPSRNPVAGQCDFCGSDDIDLVEPRQLADVFEMLVNVYEPDVAGRPLTEWMKEDWRLFSHPRMDAANARALLSEILDDGEIVRRTFSPSPAYRSEGLARWETLRDELLHKNRYFLDGTLDTDRLRELLAHLLTDPLQEVWYRARISDGDTVFTIDEMGAPPQRYATHGRANPVGIPYLYLGSLPETAAAEVRPHTGEVAYVAEFQVPSPLAAVDLRDPRGFVSPFVLADASAIGQMRADIPFLERLGEELTRPVLPRSAAIDYIPSQYLCEFIKKSGYDGVVFRSSVSSGMNLALFDPAKARGIGVRRYSITRVSVDVAPA